MFLGTVTLQAFGDVKLFGFFCGFMWIVACHTVHTKGMRTSRNRFLLKEAGAHGQTDRGKPNQDRSIGRKLRSCQLISAAVAFTALID